ncbi:thioredoxin-domain-containing protein [Conidiobolus coronatus NRRL 28638]|uniref:Thioredoxin-domain-containing protein n=1 Tax=Conidiobolus coronatus (strain ATCC 28846 / CBS 209.66 / NRRL 28638) TaxID=796925 RepID=A0A137P2B2_CONC2|nr:thioredoxin-domain-containing protein [Conidiobolus coronatus NRRL 28638]|eukprot:KXN69088.1 thioredoxin-domain-containing protein [Conidiobolus coronatus NRRL 28638]
MSRKALIFPPNDENNFEFDEAMFNRKATKGRWFIKHYVKWCPHCQHLAPVWNDIAKDLTAEEGNPFQFGQIECDEVKNLCDKHNVQGYPTLILFQDGKIEEEFNGLPEKDIILNWLKEHKTPKVIEEPKKESQAESEFDKLKSATEGVEADKTVSSEPELPTQGVEMPPPTPEPVPNPLALSIPDYAKKQIEEEKSSSSTTTEDDSDSLKNKHHIDRTITLTESKFTQAIEHGIWIIRHTSKKNPPPGRFHILWSQLTNDFSEFKKHLGFRFATIDCDEETALCERNHIEKHPTIQLWESGEFIENYEGELDYDPLAKYIRAIQSRKFNHDSTGFKTYQFPGSYPPNTEGLVDKLSSKSYASMTGEGNWLVYYMSGTCVSCRPLSNTIEEVAKQLKSKVNVAQFDCSNEIETCEKHGVKGLPFLTFVKDGVQKVYTGPTTEDKLIKFAQTSSSPNFIQIADKSSWDKFKNSEEDNYFIYNYGSKKELSDFAKLKTIFDGLYLQSDVYLVDKELTKDSSTIDKSPNFYIQKPHFSAKPYEGTLTNNQELRKWLKSNQYPTLIPLGSENFDSILSEFNYMVLGILDPGKDHFDLEELKSLSAGLTQNPTISEKKVGFGWLDGKTHLDYVHTLGRNVEDLPFIVIIQPGQNKVFSVLEDKSKFQFKSGSIETAINSLGEKKLVADQMTGSKSLLGNIKLMPSEGESFNSNHLIGLVLVALALGFVYFLFKGRFRRRMSKRQLD